jgi:hypothetical protein
LYGSNTTRPGRPKPGISSFRLPGPAGGKFQNKTRNHPHPALFAPRKQAADFEITLMILSQNLFVFNSGKEG